MGRVGSSMDADAVEVCYDDRFGVWKVDLYAVDRETGMEVHEGEEGQYSRKEDARGAAEDIARLNRALMRVETRDGRLQKEKRP